MTIKYDIPFEVTETQYKALLTKCGGIVAGRVENGKYYIKVWLMTYTKYVKQIINLTA